LNDTSGYEHSLLFDYALSPDGSKDNGNKEEFRAMIERKTGKAWGDKTDIDHKIIRSIRETRSIVCKGDKSEKTKV
jgi:hypothetical protein